MIKSKLVKLFYKAANCAQLATQLCLKRISIRFGILGGLSSCGPPQFHDLTCAWENVSWSKSLQKCLLSRKPTLS